MLYAFINDNEVKKIEDHGEDDAFAQLRYYQQIIPIDGIDPIPKVGWAWDGVAMFNKLPDITPRQLRLALVMNGINMSDVEAALDTLPEPHKSYASISWNYAVAFSRRDPLVDSVALMLGWTSEQLDDLWVFAGKL